MATARGVWSGGSGKPLKAFARMRYDQSFSLTLWSCTQDCWVAEEMWVLKLFAVFEEICRFKKQWQWNRGVNSEDNVAK